MAALISVLIFIQMTLDVFRLDLSLAPGLSAKNLVLYAVLGVLVVKMVLQRNTRFEMRGLQVSYLLLVLYALFTWYLAFAYIEYDHYPVKENGLLIKASLADFLIFFIVCFYGLRTARDVNIALRSLMIALMIANLITLTETFGITGLGIIDIREDGRVQGAMGEANQYAAFLGMTIPIYVALIVSSRGLWRLLWLGSVLIALVAMLTTVSRGGFVALAVGTAIGCAIFRRHIPVAKIAGWGIASAVFATLVLFAANDEYRSLIIDRLFSESEQADLSGASGGRTEMWAQALGYMIEKPITFITGFGWRAYWTMPFEVSPHNMYLNYWFNLGLPGLFFLFYSQGAVILNAWRAALAALSVEARYVLIGFVFGTLSLSVAIFFVELYTPWIYTWALYGIMMRLVLLQRDSQLETVTAEPRGNATVQNSDQFGWAANGKARRTGLSP